MVTTDPPITNNYTSGLLNKNSAAERIAAMQEAQQRVEDNKNNFLNSSNDGSADLGLQDRDTSSERIAAMQSVAQAVVENSGFDATTNLKNALTHNTKIINTPPLERGSLLDVRI
jgi:hypothetical protein